MCSAEKVSELDVSESSVAGFQQAARLLGVPSVERVCRKFVRTGLNVQNCLARFALADSFLGWTDTAQLIQTFIEQNFTEVVTGERLEWGRQLNEVQVTTISGLQKICYHIVDCIT